MGSRPLVLGEELCPRRSRAEWGFDRRSQNKKAGGCAVPCRWAASFNRCTALPVLWPPSPFSLKMGRAGVGLKRVKSIHAQPSEKQPENPPPRRRIAPPANSCRAKTL